MGVYGARILYACVHPALQGCLHAPAGCCSPRDACRSAGRARARARPRGAEPAPQSPAQWADPRRSHPPEPRAGHFPPRLVRSLRGKHGFSLGDASGQTDPHSSPLTPYSQHRSGMKPFCTNKPTSFQHPPPCPPKAFQDDTNGQVKGKHLGTALFTSIFLSILNPM